MVKKWIGLNILFILAVVIWSLMGETISVEILTAKTIAQVSLLFFLANINLYFVFLIIRKSKNKEIKKKLVKMSRRAMKLHIPIAVTGTSLIVVHAIIMLVEHPIDFISLKKLSGVAAFLVLFVLLFSGLLRRRKASGFRRKFHINMAFTFLLFFIIHIFN